MSNLYFKKDVHKSIEGLLYGLYVYQYLLDTSTFGLLLRCLVQEQLVSVKSKAPTLRVALYAVVAAAFLAFIRHLHPPERFGVIIDFIGNVSAPSQAIIYWLDTVILLLQVTEALIVFRVIKADETPRRSTTPPTTTTATAAAPPRTVSAISNSASTPGARGGASQSVSAGGRFERTRTEPNGAGSGSGSVTGSSSTIPSLVNHASASGSSSSSRPLEYTSRRAATTATTNNNSSNSADTDGLDDMYPQYYEDEEEERFSTDLDRQQHQQRSQGGPSTSRRNRPSGSASTRSNNHRRRRSDTDDSADEEGSTDDEDPLGDNYEEVLEQETFVFQLRFQDLVAYVFSSQEALTMPDAQALTGTSAGCRMQDPNSTKALEPGQEDDDEAEDGRDQRTIAIEKSSGIPQSSGHEPGINNRYGYLTLFPLRTALTDKARIAYYIIGVYSTANDDRVLDSIKQKTDDSILGLAAEGHVEFSLKLQEPDGYSDVWSALSNHPQNNYGTGISDENKAFTSSAFNVLEEEPNTSLLPDPSTTNLKEIQALLTSMGSDEEEQLTDFIVVEGYIDKLVSTLKICEETDLISSLHNLRAILIHLIELGELNIMEEIIKDETFVGCIGILEYEPDLLDEKAHYREMYAHRSNFKQVVPFNDSQTEVLIHQVFRLQFLKDVILFSHLEDVSRSLLETIMNRKTTRIVQKLLGDRQFLMDLFDVLEDALQPLERRQDVVLFTHQFCIMAKKTNGAIYRRLCTFGLFTLLEFAFASDNDRIKLAGVEILLMALEDSSSLVRSHIVLQAKFKSRKVFFDAIINLFLKEDDPNLMPQLAEAIRILVDVDPESGDEDSLGFLGVDLMSVESSSRLDPDAEQFLDLFYAQYCSMLLAPILQLMRTSTALDRSTSARCANICKLMSFLIRQHPIRTKVLLSSSRLVEKICILLKNRQKHMRLMALKFFRTCLGLEDDYFNRILIKNKVIHEVVGLLQETNGKNDLLNSVCLEFFSFIREKNIKLLVSHCAKIHRKELEEISYTPIFKELLALHVDDGASSITSSSSNSNNNSGSDGAPGSSSSKPLWGSQSRLFPSMRIPLFPSGNGSNQDGADSGVKSLLSSLFRHKQETADSHGDEASGTVEASEEQSSNGDSTRQDSSKNIGSSPPSLSPLPPVVLRSGIVFVKADEGRDKDSEGAIDTRLEPESAASTAGDRGAELERKVKRKREDEDELDTGDVDGPVQQRLKLDGTVSGNTDESVSSLGDNNSSSDVNSSPDNHDSASINSNAAASGIIAGTSETSNLAEDVEML
ncbi:Platinum sensitivity protein [Mortierella sp. 14UC]|nr:Platinum sensitivity protein [Mortierella sp. 14UC]